MKPILFSGEMVRAILDGRKTQTRRVIKPQPSAGVRRSVFVLSGLEDGHGRELRCPYGRPGDTLWVRETFGVITQPLTGEKSAIYKATHKPEFPNEQLGFDGSKWRPSIFMPKWASRITLKVTAVRVERVQEISNDDAHAEGISKDRPNGWISCSSYRRADGTLHKNGA